MRTPSPARRCSRCSPKACITSPVLAADGKIVGVVTATDLMDVGRHTPFSIRAGIERAKTREEVIAAGRELPDVVCALVDASSEPVGVGRIVALVVDALTTRLLELGIERSGEPPVPWAWLALGSAARHEQALHTDQDHAMALDLGDRPKDEVDPYLGDLAEFVTAGLEEAGIHRCKGDAMAANAALRKSIPEWGDALRTWMHDVSRSGSILSSIVYDFRRVAGPLDPEPELQRAMLEARTDDAFLRHLVRRALDTRPPTGFLRDLVVERKGEHVGRLDVKHGGITIVGNIARVEAIRAGIAAKGTLDRLRGAAGAGTMDTAAAKELRRRSGSCGRCGSSHQVAQVRAGQTPDDFRRPVEARRVLTSRSEGGVPR